MAFDRSPVVSAMSFAIIVVEGTLLQRIGVLGRHSCLLCGSFDVVAQFS